MDAFDLIELILELETFLSVCVRTVFGLGVNGWMCQSKANRREEMKERKIEEEKKKDRRKKEKGTANFRDAEKGNDLTKGT